jgi:hypothetical protein
LFVAGLNMNYLSPTNLTGKKTVEGGKCGSCGAQPRLVSTMLDSAKGRIIRMFKCECGQHIWASDPE